MIERFNFYDIYGYFVPGLSFLTLLFWPFRSRLADWALANLGSTILALVLAYIVGHFIHGLAQATFESRLKVRRGPGRRQRAAGETPTNRRHPSDVILDGDDSSLTPQLKKRLKSRIKSCFDLDVDQDTGRAATRQEAFLLCRQTLLANKVVTYAEQFQGMYSLLRGLFAVCYLSLAYYTGWLINSIIPWGKTIAIGLTAAAGAASVILIGLDWWKYSQNEWPGFFPGGLRENPLKFAYWSICCFLMFFAIWDPLDVMWVAGGWKLFALCMVLAVLGLRFHSLYWYFARRFAETVYQDFSIVEAEGN